MCPFTVINEIYTIDGVDVFNVKKYCNKIFEFNSQVNDRNLFFTIFP